VHGPGKAGGSCTDSLAKKGVLEEERGEAPLNI
jgi:hypothetical protein